MKYSKEQRKAMAPYLLVGIFLILLLLFSNIFNNKVNILTYDEFSNKLDDGEVIELTIIPRDSAKIYELVGKLDSYEENETFSTKAPLSESVINKILTLDKDFKIEAKSDPESGTFWVLIIYVLPILLLVGVTFYFFSKQVGGGGNKSFDFGKSKAKLNQDSNKTTFNEVAGLDEEKEEVGELIDFLKNPKKFQKMGARIPKGVL